VLDETYARLHHTGPEFEGWLSNHGPMAADALIRLGRAGQVEGWVDQYAQRLEEAPRPRWSISAHEWRDPLGDASRLGDWCALFAHQVHEEPWQDLLARWWPRLLPGAIASATHGLIRTGHAVRALREHETTQRLDELGQALGYWAARWQPLPAQQPPEGTADVGAAWTDCLASVRTAAHARGSPSSVTYRNGRRRWVGCGRSQHRQTYRQLSMPWSMRRSPATGAGRTAAR
jgi:hypothetical protein